VTPTIRRSEWLWAGVASIIILLISSLPVVAGYMSEDPAHVFAGSVFDRPDFAVHLGAMQLGAHGEWGYRMLFTSEPMDPAYVKLAYIWLGHVAAFLHMSMPLGYQIARVLAGMAALLVIYRLMAEAFPSVSLRRTGFALAATASGIGWLLLILGWLPDRSISPIDFWLIDLYVFFSVATFPHFAAVAALVLVTIVAYHNYTATRRARTWILAAIAAAAIIPIQPFAVALADLAVGGIIVGNWRSRRGIRVSDLVPLAVFILLQAPGLWYNARVISGSDVWRTFTRQNLVLSPPPLYYILGIGFLVPFALWGAWLAWKRRSQLGVMCVCWITGALVLSYAPTAIQRRFAANMTVPLALLSTYALGYGLLPLLRRWNATLIRPRRRVFLALVVAAAMPSSLYISTGGALYAAGKPDTLFDPQGLTSAIDWLGQAVGESDVVMASEKTGLLVPPRIGARTYVGHPFETLDYEVKRDLATRFFEPQGMDPAERVQLLRGCGCNWVIAGPYETPNGSEWLEGEIPSLLPMYHAQGVTIYQVSDGAPGDDVALETNRGHADSIARAAANASSAAGYGVGRGGW
jgi:hypothetical protein